MYDKNFFHLHFNIYFFKCLSTTVANGLKFQGNPATKGTEEFVRNFDYFFDCLNGQFMHQGDADRKPALAPYKSVDDGRFEVNIIHLESHRSFIL